MAKRFTDRFIDNLKPTASRYMVSEENAHGQGTLGVRVSPTGRRSFVYIYKQGRRTRFMTLGTYPEMTVAMAHEAFGKATVQRERGLDPAVAHVDANAIQRAAPTVAELVERYIAEYARGPGLEPRKKSWRRDEALLTRHLLPSWGHHRAAAMTRKDVRVVLDAIVRTGHGITANRTFEVMRKMFNWAIDEEVIEHSPCVRVPTPVRQRSRERVLSVAELRRFLERLPEVEMEFSSRLALFSLLLTAQRSCEALTMEWTEIDLERRLWTIPGRKAKNGDLHTVPLSSPALDVLTIARRLGGQQFVLPSRRGDRPMGETALPHALRRSLDRLEIAPFTPHDLRRTAATRMSEAGVTRLVVRRILNHRDAEVTATYDRYSYDAEKRAALEAWAGELGELGLDAALGQIGGQVGARVEAGWWRRQRV